MTRARGELPEAEEALLGIERPTPEQEEEAAKIAAEKALVRDTYLRDLIANPLFREWLMEQLVAMGTFINPFGTSPNGSADPMQTQFYLGRKSVGWDLWCIFDNLSPLHASMMRREAALPKP